MNKNPSQVAIAWLGFLISHTSPVFVYAILYERGETSINRYDNP